MGWFWQDGPPGPVLSVLKRTSRGEVRAVGEEAGAAVLLSSHEVLTCAHVVNDALDRPPLSTDRPVSEAVDLLFHTAGTSRRMAARVAVWVPPRPVPTGAWQGDLCVLELARPAPDLFRPAAWLEMAEGQSVRAWGSDGAMGGFADTEVKLADQGVYYLDGTLSGAAIGPGFSGGPLRVRHDPAVVGLVVAHHLTHGAFSSQQIVRRSWAVPWQTIRAELVASGAGELIDRCTTRVPTVTQDLDREALCHVVWQLLAEPVQRADHARSLASQLGYTTAADGAPSVEELVTLLITEDRALATLTESLASARGEGERPAALEALLTMGRLSDAARLLSIGEHRMLVETLKRTVASAPTLLPRAAREALRYTRLPAVLRGAVLPQEALEVALGELEELQDGGQLPDGGPSVPALLKLVEFTAAGLAASRRAELLMWNERVSRRLGVHKEALAQRRSDAMAWAVQRPARVMRLIAEISTFASDSQACHRCRMWQVRAGGEAVPMDVEGSTLRTAGEVGQLIREAAEQVEADCGQEVKDIDILVSREGLHLPIDEWDTGSLIESLPGEPLGVGYRVALHCPEITNRVARHVQLLRRRWSEASSSEPLIVDEKASEPRQLMSLLKTSHECTSQVVLHGSLASRQVLLEICLMLGVPVILWDRAAQSHADSQHLEEVSPMGPLFELPERIRTFRARMWARPESHRARPSLVWQPEEPLSLPPKGHRLTDPVEGVRTR
ncbi:trypsin-like peptidase domain-containing protein [Streptomyces chartreusis]|uniref:VMAP-C domain-containing protein n=1 Tax=Streptomyces chartreusis TaxID=1969 RepID=UPI003D8C6D90